SPPLFFYFSYLIIRRLSTSTLFPYTTLFRSLYLQRILGYQPLEIGLAYLPAALGIATLSLRVTPRLNIRFGERATLLTGLTIMTDRKSTRLNSSHGSISYAVFCLKKKSK